MSDSLKWFDVDWVAFDTETTGKYPIESEICELAAVRWSKGKIVGEFQSLLAVSKPMGEEVIAIHNITNEMLVGAPTVSQKLPEFLNFAKGACWVAHHAPFDMGFLAIDLEKLNLPLPSDRVFCSSLISRASVVGTENHRLQTLAKHFGVDSGQAHRALDDAKVCLEVSLHCFEQLGSPSLADLTKIQGRVLLWRDFSINSLKTDNRFVAMVEALEKHQNLQIEYSGGSNPGQPRTVKPIGLVRSPGQDFLVAASEDGGPPKRFYLNKIKVTRL